MVSNSDAKWYFTLCKMRTCSTFTCELLPRVKFLDLLRLGRQTVTFLDHHISPAYTDSFYCDYFVFCCFAVYSFALHYFTLLFNTSQTWIPEKAVQCYSWSNVTMGIFPPTTILLQKQRITGTSVLQFIPKDRRERTGEIVAHYSVTYKQNHRWKKKCQINVKDKQDVIKSDYWFSDNDMAYHYY